MEEIIENSICQNKDKRRGKKESGVALYDIKGLHSGYCRFAHIKSTISLQLDNGIKTAKEYYKTIKEQQEEIDSLKKEIEMLQQEHEEAIAEIEQDAAVYVEENKKIANMTSSEDTIRLQTERDTYKTMYEQLLNRLVNGGAA